MHILYEQFLNLPSGPNNTHPSVGLFGPCYNIDFSSVQSEIINNVPSVAYHAVSIHVSINIFILYTIYSILNCIFIYIFLFTVFRQQ